MKSFAFFYIFLTCSIGALAQKPLIDSVAIGRWPHPDGNSVMINADGNFFAYTVVNLPIGHNELIVQSLTGVWKQQVDDAESAAFTTDGRRLLYQVGDTVSILLLGTDKSERIGNVSSFQIKGNWVACVENGPEKRLLLLHFDPEEEQVFTGVCNYLFDDEVSKIVLQLDVVLDSGHSQKLDVLELKNKSRSTFWRGRQAGGLVFSLNGKKLAFWANTVQKGIEKKQLWCENFDDGTTTMVVDDETTQLDPSVAITENLPLYFDGGGRRLFFGLQKKVTQEEAAENEAIKLDIWHAGDEIIRPVRAGFPRTSSLFVAVANLETRGDIKKVVQLETQSKELVGQENGFLSQENGSEFLILRDRRDGDRNYRIRKPMSAPELYRVSMKDGETIPVNLNIRFDELQDEAYLNLSPGGRWLIYFDVKKRAYFSYDLACDTIRNISLKIPARLTNEEYTEGPDLRSTRPAGVGGWLKGDSAVLLYDDLDIWVVDPSAKRPPFNLTNGYGRKFHVRFRVAENMDGGHELKTNADLLLAAYDTQNKYNGFFLKRLGQKGDPKLLTMGPYSYYIQNFQIYSASVRNSFLPIKAPNAQTWIVGRAAPNEAPNYFATIDFRNFTALSDLQPQRQYNWLTAELVRWKMIDGRWSQGVLYKPENFDSTHKYPLILQFYERLSDNLYNFTAPDFSSGAINIPYFVSHGYLVFLPDIYKKLGKPGQSAVNSVVSAAQYLSRTKSWVDGRHMGISGASYGGYEVAYLVTHSHIFAAAAECCGITDLVSDYGSLPGGDNEHLRYEGVRDYFKLGSTLWARPDLYIKNSPVFAANKVTTPLLILHNKPDPGVLFSQGMELFAALWWLHKPAWLLQYDDDMHGVGGVDARDYTIRLSQFFDHFLLNRLPPRWMTEHIPSTFEGLKKGYELDNGVTK